MTQIRKANVLRQLVPASELLLTQTTETQSLLQGGIVGMSTELTVMDSSL